MVSQFPTHRLLPLLLFLSFLLLAANSDLAADRAALIRLSLAVGGRTRSWNLSDPSPCSWDGVVCDKSTGRVTELRLPGRGLSGQIPLSSIGNLTRLRTLSFRQNYLSGSIPSDLSSCTELQLLFLQGNSFSGEIPATLFALNNLVRLNFAGNKLSGGISTGFNNFTKLKTLNLENNGLIGSISELNNLAALQQLNVSFNQLNGSVPPLLNKFSSNSFLGNSLCGAPLGACPGHTSTGKKLSAGAIAAIVVGSVVGFVLIIAILFILWRIHKSRTTPRQVESAQSPSPATPSDFGFRAVVPISARENSGRRNGDSGAPVERTGAVKAVESGENDGLVFFGNGDVGFGLEELLRASAESLGKGTFGSTYKAYLEGGKVVIVKRLRHAVAEREFREKVKGLGVLSHENLVPLRAYYYGREEKLLAYDCMSMGSLSTLLHGNRGADRAALTWEIRSKIAFGAARGIEYLHSISPNTCHGNIRSSNILLTDSYDARVSENGIPQLVHPTSTLNLNGYWAPEVKDSQRVSQKADSYDARVSENGIPQLVPPTSTLNLNGYWAPEVTDSQRVSQKADVYSFGVLVLELMTGKEPTNDDWDEEGVDLLKLVQSVAQGKRTADVLDPELSRYRDREKQMVQLLRVGVDCTSQHPHSRPTMTEVSRRIEEICRSR